MQVFVHKDGFIEESDLWSSVMHLLYLTLGLDVWVDEVVHFPFHYVLCLWQLFDILDKIFDVHIILRPFGRVSKIVGHNLRIVEFDFNFACFFEVLAKFIVEIRKQKN